MYSVVKSLSYFILLFKIEQDSLSYKCVLNILKPEIHTILLLIHTAERAVCHVVSWPAEPACRRLCFLYIMSTACLQTGQSYRTAENCEHKPGLCRATENQIHSELMKMLKKK